MIPITIFYVIVKVVEKQRKIRQGKEKEYDQKILQRAVKEVLQNAEFIRDQCILPDDYGIIPRYDSFNRVGMLRYCKNGNEYLFSNIHLLRQTTDEDDNTVYETIYKGQIYTLTFKAPLSGYVRIFSTKMIPLIKKEYAADYLAKRPEEKKIETENVLFNDNFDVYASEEQSAFFFLNPIVMEKLLEMKKSYGQLGVYISGEYAVIVMETGKLLFNTRQYQAQTQEADLESAKEEIKKMLQMAAFLEDVINGKIQKGEERR